MKTAGCLAGCGVSALGHVMMDGSEKACGERGSTCAALRGRWQALT